MARDWRDLFIVDGAPAPGGEDAGDRGGSERRMGRFRRLRENLRKTRQALTSEIQATLFEDLNDETWERLEEALIYADVGARTTAQVVEQLEREATGGEVTGGEALTQRLTELLADIARTGDDRIDITAEPTVIMIVGVNGAGKTTSVGKLARHLMNANQKVLLAAADTFRAAAREQLLAWAERADPGMNAPPTAGATSSARRIEIVSQEGGDPAGVTFDAVVAGKARGCDVVIADTAGRLATQSHLMEELKKVKRVIQRVDASAPHEVLLVLDANQGQNALAQVQAFDEALQLTGLVITKLDGTAKGGVLAAIALWSRTRASPLPVYFVGVGEKLADLQTFRAREFAAALIG